ncbi:MAG: hypothetical protein A3D92_05930 [Bacteroidetes bacterium RIFCSPHIGHO2_02_FULL_44_7]|nr:MAG: hypothetical protein A3D92_05930 [Bacteroidetes bacterium RIFCSPHIGHO2_02_FULL_44_7]OHA15578.1 MAG: hypothetical protein A2825_00520 [Candidatus Taylorbacteria bacterium RIFCSPHIGHO2_01_FULL_43_120]
MKYSIRIDRTDTDSQRVQVVRYEKRKIAELKHIGTAHTEKELTDLKSVAEAWILAHPPHPQLFALTVEPPPSPVFLKDCRYQGIWHTFTYEFLHRLCTHFHFTHLKQHILIDLVIMRLFEPASKRRSLTLLNRYFGIEYSENTLYRALRKFSSLKESVEEKTVAIAKEEFGFDFSFVLYDVTTLYFETFEADEMRKPGFSKDNKSQQPQIVIGLMVTPEGFPVSYEIFAGNTFEGTTFLPTILAFKRLHKVETLTIVADAAMLSLDNIEKLTVEKLTYIVGARLGNISPKLLNTIDSSLTRTDGATTRTETLHGTLVCSYSKKRYSKDLSDMNKQIAKAENQVQNPGKMKRAKFVSVSTGKVSLNDELIAKTKKLLGVKGYYTNLTDMMDTDIITHYRSLWHIEQAFRIAKSDLATRPIFHRKEESIKAHILICVMALALSKYIEIKTKQSIHSVLDACKSVTDARILHTATNKIIVMRSKIPDVVKNIQEILSH